MRRGEEEKFILKITIAMIIYKNALYAYIFTCRSFFSTMSIVLIYYCNRKFAISPRWSHAFFFYLTGITCFSLFLETRTEATRVLHNNAKEILLMLAATRMMLVLFYFVVIVI